MLQREDRFSALTEARRTWGRGNVRDDEVRGVAREGDVEIRFSP